MGDYVPGDIVPYAHLEHTWEPRPGARELPPKQAVGKYLERPILHHTIGTLVRPSMLGDFEEFDVPSVLAHDDPPPFAPVMVRGMAQMGEDPDWMAEHLGSNLQKSTLTSVHRGRTSDEAGTSYVPSIARRVDFGRQGLTRGWDPKDITHEPRDADSDGVIEEGTPRERHKRGCNLDVF
jgi:hypothetical protein